MPRPFILLGMALAWLAFLLVLSFRLWGVVVTGTDWRMWLEAAAGAAAGIPVVLAREPALLAGPLLLVAAAFCGRALLRRVLPEAPPLFLSAGAGLVIFATAALGLGSAGWFQPAALLGFAGLTGALGLADLLGSRRGPAATPPLSRIEWLLLLPWLMLGALTVLNPTLFYDDLYYHLSLPRLYLRLHSTAPLPWHVLSCFPSSLEMLCGLALAGGSGLAPQALMLGVWAAIPLAARDMAARFVNPSSAPFALWAAAFTPAFFLSGTLFTGDPLLLLLALGGLYCLLGAEQAARRGDLPAFARWCAGWALLAGGAGGVKYTAWISALALPFALLLWTARPLGRRGMIAAMAAGAGAFLVLAPWPLRSFLACGNPIMPVTLGGIFPGLPPQSWQALTMDAHQVHWTWSTFPANLGFPWTMTFSSWDNLVREWGVAAFLGPAIWMGAPLLFLGRGRTPRVLWIYGLGALAASVGMIQVTRYAFPGLGALAAVAGAGLGVAWLRLPRNGRRAMAGLLAAASLLLLLLGARTTANQTAGYRYPRRGGDLDRYLADRRREDSFPGEHFLQYRASLLLPPNARVLLVGDGTFFFIDREVEAPTFLSGNRLIDLLAAGAPDHEAAARLRQAGFTHVLVSFAEADRMQRDYGLLGLTPETRVRLQGFAGGESCRLLLRDRQDGAVLCELPGR